MNLKHLLAASMLIISATSFAQSTFEVGGLVYMEDLSDPSKMAVIVMPKQNPATMWGMYSGNVVVPASIEHDLDTYEVVGLSSMCFMCPDLTGLEIQAPLRALSTSCIFGDNIKKIKLPDTLEELPNSSIMTPNVEEIYFGKSLKSVKSSCGQLKVTELNIPETIEKINMSFFDCPLVKTLHLKGGNLSTLNQSFTSMDALEFLSIEGKDLTIDNCFNNNTGQLRTINLSGIKDIISSFNDCSMLKTLELKGNNLSMLAESFKKMPALESLSIEGGCLSTLTESFKDLPSLKYLTLKSKNLSTLNQSFTRIPALESLSIEGKDLTIGNCFFHTGQLRTINLSGIKDISNSFSDCPMLKTLELKGDDLSTLTYSFEKLSSLESLSVKGNGLKISNCFFNSNQLQNLELSGVASIEKAFYGVKIDKLVLPEGITDIINSFNSYEGTELTLPNSLTKLDNSFQKCSNLKELTLPNSLTNMKYSFLNCPNLKIIRYGKGICSLGEFCKGDKETLYCPWNEVPKAPDVNKSFMYFVATFVVPEGMEAKYREAWADILKNPKARITFREEKF